MESSLQQIVQFATDYGIKIIGAVLILIGGRIAAGLVRGGLKKGLTKSKTDPAVVSFVGSLSFFLVLTFAVLAALAKFGIQTTSFVAVLGAAGLAIGLALQGSLANFASGVLLLILRPFRVGDYVDAGGNAGTIKEIQLFHTIMSTPDNVKVVIPNSAVFSGAIKNYNGYETRRLDMVIGIGYDSSIAKAHEILLRILSEEERLLPDPAPVVAVSELADSSVNFVVRPWVKGADYWKVKFDLLRKIKEEFDANGIEIPFPQRTVHLIEESVQQAQSAD